MLGAVAQPLGADQMLGDYSLCASLVAQGIQIWAPPQLCSTCASLYKLHVQQLKKS